MKRIRRDRRLYDDSRTTVACLRPINTNGEQIAVGDPIPKDKTDVAFRRRFWSSGRICYIEEYVPVDVAEDLVQLSDDQKKELLIARIKELNSEAKVDKRKKVDTLEAELKAYGLDPYHLYGQAVKEGLKPEGAPDEGEEGSGDGSEGGEGNEGGEGEGSDTGDGEDGSGTPGSDGQSGDENTGEGTTDTGTGENSEQSEGTETQDTGEGTDGAGDTGNQADTTDETTVDTGEGEGEGTETQDTPPIEGVTEDQEGTDTGAGN